MELHEPKHKEEIQQWTWRLKVETTDRDLGIIFWVIKYEEGILGISAHWYICFHHKFMSHSEAVLYGKSWRWLGCAVSSQGCWQKQDMWWRKIHIPNRYFFQWRQVSDYNPSPSWWRVADRSSKIRRGLRIGHCYRLTVDTWVMIARNVLGRESLYNWPHA